MMKKVLTLAMALQVVMAFANGDGARFISTNGYDHCIELKNSTTRVVIEPNCGGRVLYYELNGHNVLYINKAQDGFIWDENTRLDPPDKHICGARFDIGPEKIKPGPTGLFFHGRFTGEIIGKRSARIVSKTDTVLGIQLMREFSLDAKSSELTIKLVIKNVGHKPAKYCSWIRAFGAGNGIAVCPVGSPSRFPKGYITYDGPTAMLISPPDEPTVSVRDGMIEISGPTVRPKFVIDSEAGWLAYLTRQNVLFVQKFVYKKNKQYGEMTGAAVSVWYNGTTMTELEPMGTWDWIEPGRSSAFEVKWYLQEMKFPDNGKADLPAVTNLVKACK